MKPPGFFIVGAPKSGTTFLHDRLGDHPDVFVPARKEIHYFGSDLKFARPRLTRDEYLRLFQEAKEDQTVGEASVWYLLSENAATEIHTFSSDARILILLRNPVDMIFSLHNQMLHSLDEDIADFREALDAEEDRRAGRRLPRRLQHQRALDYTGAATYSPQVRRYLNVFPREQVFVGLFDDLISDPNAFWERAVRFLGLEPIGRIRTDPVNPRKWVRSKTVHRLVSLPPPWVSKVGRRILSPGRRARLAGAIRRFNTGRSREERLDPETRRWLGLRFQDDVEELSRLIERDLSGWIESWLV